MDPKLDTMVSDLYLEKASIRWYRHNVKKYMYCLKNEKVKWNDIIDMNVLWYRDKLNMVVTLINSISDNLNINTNQEFQKVMKFSNYFL